MDHRELFDHHPQGPRLRAMAAILDRNSGTSPTAKLKSTRNSTVRGMLYQAPSRRTTLACKLFTALCAW